MREIGFALALGALGAGGAALMLNDDVGPRDRREAREDAQVTTYALTDFTEVSVMGPQDVEIVQGPVFAVTASGRADAVRQLEAVVEGGVLVIRPREGTFFGTPEDLEDVTYTVTMPSLMRVVLAGSGDVSVDRVTGDRFEGRIDGSGTMAVEAVETTAAAFTVTGSGDLDASGTVGTVAVDIGGSGAFHAKGLESTNATVAIEGSGEVELTVLEQAAIVINGSGDVDISGPGLCSVTSTGSGDVRCEGSGGDDN